MAPHRDRKIPGAIRNRATGDALYVEGYDAGVSFRSVHNPVTGVTHTVVANSSNGAWPVAEVLRMLLET